MTSSPQQRTEDWLLQRLGMITGSRIKDVVAKTLKGTPTAARETYMWEKVHERMIDPDEFTPTNYTTFDMQWGIDQEPYAVEKYQEDFGLDVEEAFFVVHPSMPFAGGSPDGLVGSDGIIEVKCCRTANHLKAIYNNEPPAHFLDQCHWNIAVTNSDWCDLILYDPRCRPEQVMKVFRINRDDEHIAFLEAEVQAFNADIEAVIKTIKENSNV